MRILVVDDEKLLVKGIKFNLENEGYEVECAYDGAAAVELARAGRFDLVILDLMMPEIDGLEAGRLYHQALQHPGAEGPHTGHAPPRLRRGPGEAGQAHHRGGADPGYGAAGGHPGRPGGGADGQGVRPH